MPSNLPCSSADGGIDYAFDDAIEKVLDMATKDGLNAEELIYAMSVGIEAVKLMRPIIDEAIRLEEIAIRCEIDDKGE